MDNRYPKKPGKVTRLILYTFIHKTLTTKKQVVVLEIYSYEQSIKKASVENKGNNKKDLFVNYYCISNRIITKVHAVSGD